MAPTMKPRTNASKAPPKKRMSVPTREAPQRSRWFVMMSNTLAFLSELRRGAP
ncbi:hypothetical protein ACFPRL_05805 [Pseudoclavibacter helvolus]